ncbi:porin family protein [uncultured Mucilaginibacter sp.]|uniref:porin family protein n=1 Tax=uncultured Mucilaginibacter sp. TaxID=797541 RepID=UPI0025F1D1B4|nr:porin family protein [uncultured Mucilaginibacter sp.]
MQIRLSVFLLFIAHFAIAHENVFVSGKANSIRYSYLIEQKDSSLLLSAKNNVNLVHIGVETGLCISNIVYSQHPYLKGAIAGFNAGVNFDIPVEFSFSFDAAVLYTQKGCFSTTSDGSYTQKLSFIDVPLLLKFASTHSKFNFFLGPQLSVLTSSNNTFEPGFTGNRGSYNYKGGKFFIDGVVGESFDITDRFNIHVRYSIDLNSTNSSSGPDFRNQVYQIGFGVRLD